MKLRNLNYRDFHTETKIVSMIFTISLLLGFIQSGNPPQIIIEIINSIEEMARQVIDGQVNLFSLIVVNNIIAVTTIVIGGLLFGVSPVISGITNGYLIGVVGGQIIAEGDWLLFLVGIIPHGIIEIPTLITSLAIGLRLGRVVVKELFKDDLNLSFTDRLKLKLSTIWSELSRSLYFCFRIIIPLVVLAAVIESFVTPALINLVI